MEPIKVLIADDELPSRGELSYELKCIGGVKEVGQCANGKEVLAFLKNHPNTDLIFLDIEMPIMDGLTCAEKIRHLGLHVPFVFATGYEKFAIRAFDLEAFDYVLKPFREERIAQTIRRFQERRELLQAKKRDGEIIHLDEQIKLKSEDRTIVLLPADIAIVSTDKTDYCNFYTSRGIIQSRIKLKEAESILQEKGFFRVHKSYIVNLSKIHEIFPQDNGTLLLAIQGFEKEKIPVSRHYLKSFKDCLHLSGRNWGI
jgi:DNA-binding LytR/AlgR family response regulator